jgi:hypothetical protein
MKRVRQEVLVMVAAVFAAVVHEATAARSQKGPGGEPLLDDADIEKLFLSVPSNDTAREHLYKITKTAHIAGTPESLEVAGSIHKHIYMHTYMHTYVRTYIHTYIHTYIYTYIHTYIHTCIHAYTHTHTHTHVHKS